MQLVWLVGKCMLLDNLTLMLFFISYVIWRGHLDEDFCTSPLLLCLWQVLVMLTRLVVLLISSPHLATAPLLVTILLLGAVKSRMLLLILVLKPRCYGFNFFFVTWVLVFLLLCSIVTIRLLAILCSMNVPNTLRLIVTSFGIYWKKQIVTTFVCSDDWLGDIFTKPSARASFEQLSFKLGMFNLYAPAWGEVLRVIFWLLVLLAY